MSGPLLVLDASTYRGTVAVIDDGGVRAERETRMRGEREERLMPAVVETLAAAGVTPSRLGGIVCGAGPGSFTSLRIAASIGKAMAAATGLPLYAVSSLLLVVAGNAVDAPPGRYLAMLDAMRGEYFATRVALGADQRASVEGEVELLDAATAEHVAVAEGRTCVGPGQALDWWPHARGVASLPGNAHELLPVDLTAWEPSYGRLAEAQVKWERAHGRSLSA